MSLWVSSISCTLNLLLIRSHQEIIVKRFNQKRNNVTTVRIEPRSCDQGCLKNNVFALSATLTTQCNLLDPPRSSDGLKYLAYWELRLLPTKLLGFIPFVVCIGDHVATVVQQFEVIWTRTDRSWTIVITGLWFIAAVQLNLYSWSCLSQETAKWPYIFESNPHPCPPTYTRWRLYTGLFYC